MEKARVDGVIKISQNGKYFVNSRGEFFVPWGTNYFYPGQGWPPQTWKLFDLEKTRQHLYTLAELGCNVIRVFLSWGSFMEGPNKLCGYGLEKFALLMDEAAKVGIRLHPAGPDHWEGVPEWASGNYITDEKVLTAQEFFFSAFCKEFQDRPEIFAYDIKNEPGLSSDETMVKKWLEYRTEQGKAKVWPEEIPEDIKYDGTEASLEFQRLRMKITSKWADRITKAIRSTGTTNLITCGLMWTGFPPLFPAFTGISIKEMTEVLDFPSIHYYPQKDISNTVAYRDTLDEVQIISGYYASFGKPLLFGEFGWPGGNEEPFFDGGRTHLPSPEELSGFWSSDLVKATRVHASGWLCWGAFDMPESTDLTRHSGLFDAAGRPKVWGQYFRLMANDIKRIIPATGAVKEFLFSPDQVIRYRNKAKEVFQKMVLENRLNGPITPKEIEDIKKTGM